MNTTKGLSEVNIGVNVDKDAVDLGTAVQLWQKENNKLPDDCDILTIAKMIGFKKMKLLTLEKMKKAYCQFILHFCRGNKRQAAKILGVSVKTIYNYELHNSP